MKNKIYQTGVILIEIMIAMLIGIFLLGGILQIFIGSKQTYRMQEALSRLQENDRFSMDLITQNIRMAGYRGCSSSGPINVIATPTGLNPNPLPPTLFPGIGVSAVIGADTITDNWNANACGANECIAGTDAVTYYSGGACDGRLTGNMVTDNANIQITAPNNCNINQYDIVIISDCSTTDVFVATSASLGAGKQTIAHAQNQNSANNLSKAYGTDAEILKFHSFSFFIRTGASGRPALWRLDNALAVGITNPVELVEGIEDMQVLYGADTDGDGTPNYYVAADAAGLNLDQVVSVRISFLVSTIDDNLAATPVPYTYNGSTNVPGDRRLRRVFTTTIAIRNRLS